jgi:hypothetical protein
MGDALPTEVVPKKAAYVRRRSRDMRYITIYFLLGGLGSLIAGVVGTFILFGLGAVLSLFFAVYLLLFNLQAVFYGIVWCTVLACPLNFLLLPLTALILQRPIARDLLFPIVGFLGGVATAWIGLRVTGDSWRPSASSFLVVGSIAGAVSGLFYARALNELDR